jgi:hypothetical protein
VAAFPLDSIPLAFWHATATAWDASGTDTRALLSTAKRLSAGANISLTETGTNVTIAADSAVGSGTELQYHKNGKLGAVAASSVTSAGGVRLGGAIPANNALLTIGDAVSSGVADGTALGVNAPAGFTGDLANFMTGGSSLVRVTALGDILLPGSSLWKTSELRLAADGSEASLLGNAASTAGSSVRLAVTGVAATNQIRIGPGSGPAASVVVNGLGKTAVGTLAPEPATAANGADLIVQDATAGSGSTQVVISAGAGQDRALTQWVSFAGIPGARVSSEGALQNLPYGAQPACDAAARGMFWHAQGAAGVKDDVQVCAKDATDGFAWRSLF